MTPWQGFKIRIPSSEGVSQLLETTQNVALVVQAMAGHAILHNKLESALSLFIGFYSMLRTGELLGLASHHICMTGPNKVAVRGRVPWKAPPWELKDHFDFCGNGKRRVRRFDHILFGEAVQLIGFVMDLLTSSCSKAGGLSLKLLRCISTKD